MNVVIRPLVEEDAYTSVRWRNMPELWEYTEYKWTREITIEDELNWIRKVIVDKTCARFAIVVDDVYVGNIYITGIKDGVGEYSIFIGEKSYWGIGVARKASEQIIDYARKKLRLSSIVLRVDERNAAAVRIYGSLGFIATGREDPFTWMRLDL